jgi:hypothetical protein
MKKKNINELMQEILKFRDRPSRTDKSDPPKSADDLCCRDWAHFHNYKNCAELNVGWEK